MIRCALCPNVNKCLPPSGPETSRNLFIFEAPGKDEQQKGRILVGKTGQELDQQYLPLAGLRRREVLCANAISCMPDTNKGKLDPKNKGHQALLTSCASTNLYPLIERGKFKALIPNGRFAADATIAAADLDIHHGMPLESFWGIPAFPMYHPALGIHEPKKMSYIRADWTRLGLWLRGKLRQPVDPYKGIEDYRELTEEAELGWLDPTMTLGADTESLKTREPYCVTLSQVPGSGFLIRASRKDLLKRLGAMAVRWEAPVAFHNLPYDWPIVQGLGLHFPHRRLVDTMSLAFHLGNLPQGLKALVYRELAMTMQDFKDVVRPFSTAKVLAYYRLAQSYEWPKPEPKLEVDSKTGLWKLKNPQGMNTKFKRFFTDFSKNEDKDVFDMWGNWKEEHANIEAVIGSWPGMCISHVPFARMLYYACRDADATVRLLQRLRAIQRQVRRQPAEKWREAA